MADTRKNKFVERVEDGFVVSVPQRDPNKAWVTKSFQTEGGTLKAAREAAIAWRDATFMTLHGHPVTTRKFGAQTTFVGTGIAGVQATWKTKRDASGKTVRKVDCYIAKLALTRGTDYAPPRDWRVKAFRVSVYGKAEALKLATLYRAEMVNRLERGGRSAFEAWWATQDGRRVDRTDVANQRLRLARGLVVSAERDGNKDGGKKQGARSSTVGRGALQAGRGTMVAKGGHA